MQQVGVGDEKLGILGKLLEITPSQDNLEFKFSDAHAQYSHE